MATEVYEYKIKQDDGTVVYTRSLVGAAITALGGRRNATVFGDVLSSEANYLAADGACAGNGEIDAPVGPTVNPIKEISFEWDPISTSFAFLGGARVSDNELYEAYLQPLDGQAVPTPFYLQLAVTSKTIGGASANREFYHGPKSQGYAGVLPGPYNYIVRRYNNDAISLSKQINLVATAVTSAVVNAAYAPTYITDVGYVSLANANGTAVVLRTGTLADGTSYNPTAYLSSEFSPPATSFQPGGTTIQHVWNELPAGTYTDTWKGVNETDPALFKRVTYTIANTGNIFIDGPQSLGTSTSAQYTLANAGVGSKVWSLGSTVANVSINSSGLLTNNSSVVVSFNVQCLFGGTLYLKQVTVGAATAPTSYSLGNLYSGEPVAIPITAIDYKWTYNAAGGGTLSSFEFWVANSGPTGISVAIQQGSLSKTPYVAMIAGSYGGAYNYYTNNYNSAPPGYPYTLFFRRAGETTDFFSITIPAPTAGVSIARKTIYPA